MISFWMKNNTLAPYGNRWVRSGPESDLATAKKIAEKCRKMTEILAQGGVAILTVTSNICTAHFS